MDGVIMSHPMRGRELILFGRMTAECAVERRRITADVLPLGGTRTRQPPQETETESQLKTGLRTSVLISGPRRVGSWSYVRHEPCLGSAKVWTWRPSIHPGW